MIFRDLLKQICTSKSDNAISISWNINDKLIDNIDFCKDYDKIFSLKHFMLKYGYSLIEINNYLKYKDPFIKVKSDIKSAIDTNESMTLDEKSIEKNINFIKLLLIEDNKEKHDLENAFVILINTIILELNISFLVTISASVKVLIYLLTLVAFSFIKSITNDNGISSPKHSYG